MNGKMTIASFGRARDLQFIVESRLEPADKDLLLAATDAVHDLRDGIGSLDSFLETVRTAIWSKHAAVRDPALTLLTRVSDYHPECLRVWVDLAQDPSWTYRFAVACRLYWQVPEALSNLLFSELRNDMSKRVRDISIERYEWRADEKGYLQKVFEASDFDCRVARGEVGL
jgi:hypothetical protein